jgi:hypothetical protein
MILDRRTAMAEAFDSAEADAKGEEYTPPVHEETPPEDETRVEPAPIDKDPAELEQKAADTKAPKDRPRTRGVPPDERAKPAETTDTGVKPEGQPPTGASDKAPLGWGPTRDALWAKVPADVRSAISKREHEIQQGMSQAGRIKQVAEEYHQVIMPFEHVIKSMNSTPRQALTNVMQTATALIVGTQAQKVAVLTEMIERYGVDLPELDKALTASLSKKGSNPQPQQQQALDPRLLQQLQPLFSLQQRLEQAEGQKQTQLQTEAAEAINSVAGEQYFADVRDDMADIMEISAKRGVIMTIKQAYDKACQIHPEIGKLMARPAARTTVDAVARARRASSTVRGAPASAVQNSKMDRRAALEAAWDSQ